MAALLEYLLLVLRVIVNMNLYGDCPSRRQVNVFKERRHKKIKEQIIKNEDSKALLDNMQQRPLAAMYSLELMSDVVKKVQTVLTFCTTQPFKESSFDIDDCDLYSKPSFCYFFIKMQPQSQCHKITELVSSCNDTALELSSSSIVYKARQFPQSRRRKTISESSDDSFILFEEDPSEHRGASDDDDNKSLSTYCKCNTSRKKIQKRVQFNMKPEIHIMHAWDFAYRAARKSDWQVYARDRARFQQRIQRLGIILSPILNSIHRRAVYSLRFSNKNDDPLV